jgi:hypothetical protein
MERRHLPQSARYRLHVADDQSAHVAIIGAQVQGLFWSGRHRLPHSATTWNGGALFAGDAAIGCRMDR